MTDTRPPDQDVVPRGAEAILDAHGAPPVEEAAPAPRPRTRRFYVRVGLLVVACALVLSAVGWLVADQIAERDQFTRAHSSLVDTRQHIAAESAALTRLRHKLADLTTQVGNDTTAVSQTTAQLNGAQSELTAAKTHATEQTSLIGSLQTCLGGVQRSLNALSLGALNAAVNALNSVTASCNSASAANG